MVLNFAIKHSPEDPDAPTPSRFRRLTNRLTNTPPPDNDISTYFAGATTDPTMRQIAILVYGLPNDSIIKRFARDDAGPVRPNGTVTVRGAWLFPDGSMHLDSTIRWTTPDGSEKFSMKAFLYKDGREYLGKSEGWKDLGLRDADMVRVREFREGYLYMDAGVEERKRAIKEEKMAEEAKKEAKEPAGGGSSGGSGSGEAIGGRRWGGRSG